MCESNRIRCEVRIYLLYTFCLWESSLVSRYWLQSNWHNVITMWIGHFAIRRLPWCRSFSIDYMRVRMAIFFNIRAVKVIFSASPYTLIWSAILNLIKQENFFVYISFEFMFSRFVFSLIHDGIHWSGCEMLLSFANPQRKGSSYFFYCISRYFCWWRGN